MALSRAHDRLTIPSRVVTRVIPGATILLNTLTGRYFTLDDIGSRAWALVTSTSSLQEMFEALLIEFDADADELWSDLEDLVATLDARGLVEIHRGE